MVQQLNKRRPQTQRLHVVRVVDGLDQLLKVVERDQLVFQVDLVRMESRHGVLHQLSLGGATEERLENLRIDSAITRGGGRRGVVGISRFPGGIRVLNTPSEEVVQSWIHREVGFFFRLFSASTGGRGNSNGQAREKGRN